ncbi:phage major tail tube protein [Marinomonas mediterranea]|jgi:Phage tail tube protein FII|uniref:Major tail tube protein n=1 Tax=Marinomonas mediterranea (strain ATCC 700492 / JCM 21426 / NBRC 103028 / MMB-1) TaxID=717774 RepID=F2K1Q9_MARM1|nr:phage major tail tube protein [Marinomonas mediterranea]ADZ93393.1 major tail tube protein [Marinomonas mediterranea MMB-1]WCN19387.1 hypothetical protein GV053_21235 [Marinomonas mediterranea MMB-1]
MTQVPQYLSAMTVFIDGVGLLGTAKQVTLPKVEITRETVTAGGFERAMSNGVFKAMEAEITLNEYHDSVFKAANKLTKPPLFVIKGNLSQDGQDYPIEATVKGSIDIDDGNWETGKEVERKLKVYVDFYALKVNGTEQCMLDAKNMIAKINDVDLLEKARTHVLS